MEKITSLNIKDIKQLANIENKKHEKTVHKNMNIVELEKGRIV